MSMKTVELFGQQVLDTSELSEAGFREFRSNKIGGSDAPTICGENEWKSSYNLYLEKQGEIEVEVTAAMEDGHIYEPRLLDEWEKRNPSLTLRRHLCLVHPDRPYMIANLDGLGINGSIQRVVESKKAGDRSIKMYGLPGGEMIPKSHYIQVQYYMGIVYRMWGTDVPTDLIVKDPKLRVDQSPMYRIELDLDFFAALEAYAEEFHERLVKRIPPDVDGSKETEEYLRRQYLKDVGTSKEADSETTQIILVYRDTKARREKLEAEEQRFKNKLIEYLGANSFLTVEGVPQVSFKATKDGQTTDWKGICEAIGVDPDVVNQYTQVKHGSRRFLLM